MCLAVFALPAACVLLAAYKFTVACALPEVFFTCLAVFALPADASVPGTRLHSCLSPQINETEPLEGTNDAWHFKIP